MRPLRRDRSWPPVRNSPLLVEPSIQSLRFIVRFLNGVDRKDMEARDALQDLITTWEECGRSLQAMWRRDRELEANMTLMTCMIVPFGEGGKVVAMPKTAQEIAPSHHEQAISMFTTLMVHPRVEEFAGQCTFCSTFFLKESD